MEVEELAEQVLSELEEQTVLLVVLGAQEVLG